MYKIYYLIFGLSFHISFNFIGNLYLTQILIVISFFYFYFERNKTKFTNKKLNNIIYLGILWLIGQVISDVINESLSIDYYRGIAKIIITLMSFYVFFKINLKDNYGLIKLLAYIVFIQIIFFLISINSLKEFEYFWKMGLGTAITLMLLIYFNFKKDKQNNNFIILLLISLSILSLSLNTRYLFILNLTSAFFIFLSVDKRNKDLFNLDIKYIFITSIFILVITYIFQYLLSSNIMPEELVRKTISQKGKYGILIGGRSDLVAGIKAISDSPIFGHGSWAKDCFYSDYLKDFLYFNEYNKVFRDKNCLIPGHSIILEAWIYSGFIGFLFWLHILFLVIKRIKINFLNFNKFNSTLIFLTILFLWDLFLSPYGGIRIVEFPLFASILIFMENKKIKR